MRFNIFPTISRTAEIVQKFFESVLAEHLKNVLVSVVSIESVKLKSAKLQKHWESVHLEDHFYYVHLLFLLLGLMHFLPYTFFVTANAVSIDKFVSFFSYSSKKKYTVCF